MGNVANFSSGRRVSPTDSAPHRDSRSRGQRTKRPSLRGFDDATLRSILEDCGRENSQISERKSLERAVRQAQADAEQAIRQEGRRTRSRFGRSRASSRSDSPSLLQQILRPEREPMIRSSLPGASSTANVTVTGVRLLPNGSILVLAQRAPNAGGARAPGAHQGPHHNYHGVPLLQRTEAPRGAARVDELMALLAAMQDGQLRPRGQQERSGGPAPASRAQVSQLPSTHGSARDGNCSICLEAMGVRSSVKTLPCWHRFHESCIDRWLGLHNSCPVCKTAVGTVE